MMRMTSHHLTAYMTFKRLTPNTGLKYRGFRYDGTYIYFTRAMNRELDDHPYAIIGIDKDKFSISVTDKSLPDCFNIKQGGYSYKISCKCDMPKGRYLQDPEDPTIFTLEKE